MGHWFNFKKRYFYIKWFIKIVLTCRNAECPFNCKFANTEKWRDYFYNWRYYLFTHNNPLLNL